MRRRERIEIVDRIRTESESKQGRPISVRPFDADCKKLEEISIETGENKAAIVRRMIHFALTKNPKHFGTRELHEKLDWLVRTGRQTETVNLAINDKLTEINERVGSVESNLQDVQESEAQLLSLVTEIFAMSSMTISSLNLLFTKLLEFNATAPNDRKQSVTIASTAMAELIGHAVSDLRKCLLFHDHPVANDSPQKSYLETKIRMLKQRIESLPKLTGETETSL